MARKSTKGTRLLGAEIDEPLFEAVRAFARERRETLREVLEMALRRHIANPPPIMELPPLPPMPPPVVATPKKKGGKK